MKGFKRTSKGGCEGHEYPSKFGFSGSSGDRVVVKGHVRSSPQKTQNYALGGSVKRRLGQTMGRAVAQTMAPAAEEVVLPSPTVDQEAPVSAQTAVEGVAARVVGGPRRGGILGSRPVTNTLATAMQSPRRGVTMKTPRRFGAFQTKPMFK